MSCWSLVCLIYLIRIRDVGQELVQLLEQETMLTKTTESFPLSSSSE